MILTRINQEYTVNIPAPFRSMVSVGQEVAISADAQGRLIITPVEQVRALLMETFGMWAGRSDLSGDSIDYVDEIRRGQRLDTAREQLDETD
jgi:hypothetical protein